MRRNAVAERAREHGRVHADEYIIPHHAGMHNGAVADRHIVADDARPLICDMKTGDILNIDASPMRI